MRYQLITVVASKRGIIALRHLLSELPSTFSTPIACLVESSAGLVEQLQASTRLKVRWAEAGMPIEKGHVYLSRPGTSLIAMPGGTMGIAPFGPESSAMNPVDNFVSSAAAVHGRHLLCLVLSGFDSDGVAGCDDARKCGGCVLVLDRATSRYWGMAEPIVQAGAADRVLTIVEVAEALRGCFTSQDLLRCAEIQVRLGELLEAAMRVTGTRMGHVTRRMHESDRLGIVVQRGLGLDFFERFEAMPMDCDTAWCLAVRLKQRIVIPDVSREPKHPGRALECVPYRAEFAVPLLVAEPQVEARGALTTLFPDAHAANGLESRYLDDIAREAAQLIAGVS